MSRKLPAPGADKCIAALCGDWQTVDQICDVMQAMHGVGFDLTDLENILKRLEYNLAIEGRTRLMEPRDRNYQKGARITEFRLGEKSPFLDKKFHEIKPRRNSTVVREIPNWFNRVRSLLRWNF